MDERIIEEFLAVSSGDGSCYVSGDGDGDLEGSDYGCGNVDGAGSGFGEGFGDGSGDGSGYGYSYRAGSGDGSGDEGSGYGNGHGNGAGYGGDGLKEYEDKTLYIIDNVATAIESVHGNLAKGFVINYSCIKVPCYIAKVDECFAHGKTAEEAYSAAQTKAFMAKPIKDRISDIVEQHPDVDVKISNKELFVLHNRLTGSCEFGRRQFAELHGIDVEHGSMTMREFCELTKDAYGGENIKMLAKAYGIKFNKS